MFQAAIFDLDGLIIDSEPIWREVESEIFTRHGIPLKPVDCAQTMGMRVDEVTQYWQRRFPKVTLNVEDTIQEIVEGVVHSIETKGEPMPGLEHALTLCQRFGLKLGLASSSSTRIIQAVLKRLQLTKTFQVVCSAEYEPKGKPAPDVYFSTLRKLGIHAAQTFALEDSINGVKSANAAGIYCICIPSSFTDRSKIPADLILESLAQLSEEMLKGYIP